MSVPRTNHESRVRDRIHTNERGGLANLVEDVECRHVNPIPLNDINELVHRDILSQNKLGARNLVFSTYQPSYFDIHALCLLDHLLNVDAAALLLDVLDVGRILVHTDAEIEQFLLNNLLVRQWLTSVQDNENQVAGASCANDLSTATL